MPAVPTHLPHHPYNDNTMSWLSSPKRTKTAAPPSVRHGEPLIVAVLCILILLVLAVDTTLEGKARRNTSFDTSPATVLVVVARVLVLLVVAGVVVGAECEHTIGCSKGKARQARASRHTKEAGSCAIKDWDSGKALSVTDCDTTSSSDSESSNASESDRCYEQGALTPLCRRRVKPYKGVRGESTATAEAAASQGAAHGVDGAQVRQLTEEGGDRRAASIDGCTELAARHAPDAARCLQPAARTELPDAFLCPLTLEPMQNPVVTCDGQTYERGAIEQWLRRSSTSPLTGQQLQHLGLAPNVVLRGLIRDALEGL